VPARCERLHRCIRPRGGGIVGRASSDTHWRYAARLQREYPSIRVEQIASSVGTATYGRQLASRPGIDLALALIEEDHGFAIAKAWHSTSLSTIAAMADNPNSPLPSISRQRMTGLPLPLAIARDHIAEALTVERLAEAVGMSLRQFSRAFRAQTGTTPARVVERSAPMWPEAA